MKTIIAGSRNFISTVEALVIFDRIVPPETVEVVSGGARGVDRLGEEWARKEDLPIKQFIPDWDGIGKSAGYRRNVDMAEYADALVAIWDGQSRGTKHMIDIAKRKGLSVYVHLINQ